MNIEGITENRLIIAGVLVILMFMLIGFLVGWTSAIPYCKNHFAQEALECINRANTHLVSWNFTG